nr:putative ribonuclease H-like domain-containing protein [Tanacetum cinerariifolium]
MALPKDHLAKFYKMADKKEMCEAIKSRFSGYDRFQTLLSQLEIHSASVSHEDANQEFLRSLPSSWSQVALIMRTKPWLNTLSFDDLYNNLRVFERDVKGTTASSSNTQNVAFVSAENTRSTNDVSTAYSVSSLSVSKSQKEGSSSYTDEINDDDMEEMDLKWQVAMISMRIKKFHKRTGRKLQDKGNQDSRRRDAGYNGNKARDNVRIPAYQDGSKDLVTIDGEDIDWSGHVEKDAHNYAMMAYSSSNSVSDNEDKEKPSFTFTDSVKHGNTSRENVKETGTPNHSPKVEKQDRNGHTRKGLGYAFTRKSCFVCGSFSHLIRDCDFYEKNGQTSFINQKQESGPKAANNSAGTQANDDQSANSKEINLHEEHFVLPIWSAYSTTVKSSRDKIEKTTNFKTCKKPVQAEKIFLEELKKLKRQEKEANVIARKETTHENQNAHTGSTNLLNTISTPISTAGPSRAFNDGKPLYPDYPLMPHLKDIYASPSEGIFTDSSYDDEDLPFGKKAIGTKWVYRNKKDKRGVVVRNKERLVAQGNRQEEGIDYDEVKQKKDSIFISQDKYVTEILKKFDFLSMKNASTPIETHKPLVKDEEAVDVDVTSKTLHLQAVKRIFRYLKGQPKLGLSYPKVSSFNLEAYSNSDYTGGNFDRKSTIEGCQFHGRRLISWKCKKQTIMATFTIEAEYVTAAYCLYQMDVKSTFLYGTIDEEVYVMQPPGFQDPAYLAKVYKVKKAMCGLHQAPRAWYGTLSKYLLKNGFQRGTIDQTLFIKRHREDFILVQVYVDDIIFRSLNLLLCREFEALMHEKFQMSAMGELNFFLGLQVL